MVANLTSQIMKLTQLSKAELSQLKQDDVFAVKNTNNHDVIIMTVESTKIVNGKIKIRYSYVCQWTGRIRFNSLTINDSINAQGEQAIYSESSPGKMGFRSFFLIN